VGIVPLHLDELNFFIVKVLKQFAAVLLVLQVRSLKPIHASNQSLLVKQFVFPLLTSAQTTILERSQLELKETARIKSFLL
jgi:hypothetical protein